MENLLTLPEAFALIIAGLTTLYFIMSVKPQEDDTEVVEEVEDNSTNLAYLERQGACIQIQHYY